MAGGSESDEAETEENEPDDTKDDTDSRVLCCSLGMAASSDVGSVTNANEAADAGAR